MKNNNIDIVVYIFFISVLSTIGFFVFHIGNNEWIKLYIAFLVIVWILTLGFWPWWGTKKRKRIMRRQNLTKDVSMSQDKIDNEDNSFGNLEIKKNPKTFEVPYKE